MSKRHAASGEKTAGQMRNERNAFSRAKEIFAAIKAARALPDPLASIDALDEIEKYRSRGKGRGTPSRRYGNPPGKYRVHQGRQERIRRQVGGWAYYGMTKRKAQELLK
jgi:hypothetical protein